MEGRVSRLSGCPELLPMSFAVRCLLLTFVVCLASVSAPRAFAQDADGAAAPKADRLDESNPLLLPPQTPAEEFSVVLLMVDLGRLDLARQYLDKFAAGSPSPELLLELREKHGTAAFLKLAQIKELQPVSTTLNDELSQASREQAANPEFISKLLDQLSGTPLQRELAITELKNLGAGTVGPILQRMQSTKDVAEQDLLVFALTKMGAMTIEPLIAGLGMPQEATRVRVIDALGYLRAEAAIPELFGLAFTPALKTTEKTAALRALGRIIYGSPERADRLSDVVALKELQQRTLDYLLGQGALSISGDRQATVWAYDPQQNLVVERQLPANVASAYLATRAARGALGISPERLESQQLYLTSYLTYETATGIPASQSAGMLRSISPELLSSVLAESLKVHQPGTAIRVIDALVDQRSELALQSNGAVKSPLKSALNYPDDRVQFAAATAILQLAPQSFEATSNQVIDILSRSLVTGTEPRAIVMDADDTRGTATGGYLSDMGFETIRVETGQQGFKAAVASTQTALLVIDVNIARWDLSQTLANFRADARTASLPILLYGPESTRAAITRKLTEYPPIHFVAEASTTEAFQSQVRDFLARYKPASLTPEERGQMRGDAVDWLSYLARMDQAGKLNLDVAKVPLLALVDDPKLGPAAQQALLGIGTRDVQSRLAEVVKNSTLPENLRATATKSLLTHSQRYGWTMTTMEEKALFAALDDVPEGPLNDALQALRGSRVATRRANADQLEKYPLPPLPALN